MITRFFIGASLLGSSSLGLHYLNESELIFRVKHALQDFGFTLIKGSHLYEKECKNWIGYSFYSVHQEQFLLARKHCVIPVTFHDLAKSQGLIPIDVWKKQSNDSDTQPDWFWAASIYDKTGSTINEDLKHLLKKNVSTSPNSLSSGGGGSGSDTKTDSDSTDDINSNYTEQNIKTKLSSELEAFTDETQKTEFIKKLSQLLNIIASIEDLKLECWALGGMHHNDSDSEYTDEQLEKDWNLYVKYCTKFDVN